MKTWVVNSRIAFGGMWAFFLSVGVVRGLTVLEKHFTRYYETNTAGISLMSSLLLLGYLVGGLSAGVVIPKFGVKIPTILSGVSCIIGSCIIALTMFTKNLTIPYIIVMLMLGTPQGLCINTTMASSRFNVKYEYVGLVMTLMGGGVSVAALILPKLYKTIFNYAFDHQPIIVNHENKTNYGLTMDSYPYFDVNVTKRVCEENVDQIYKKFEDYYSHDYILSNCANLTVATTGYNTTDEYNNFWRYINSLVSKISDTLILDMKRSILFHENELAGNFVSLHYPLMIMWYFIAATMFMLVVSGVLILEKPSMAELKKLAKKEESNAAEVEDSSSSSSSDASDPKENNRKQQKSKSKSKSGKKKIEPSKSDINSADISEQESTDTVELLKDENNRAREGRQTRGRSISNMLESLQVTLPKDYGNMTGTFDNEKTLEEQVGLFSWKLATQYSFLCHSVAQLLFFSGYFCILPYLDGLLAYFEMPEVERPDFILIMGVAEIFSRLWHAFYLVDRFNKLKLISFTYFGDGVGLMICLLGYFYRSYWKVFMIMSFIIGGYFNAGFGGLVMACLVEIVDVEYFSIGVAMQSVSIGLGESLGPIIGGAANNGQFEGDLGYLVAVLVGCILMMLGGLVAGLMFFAFRYEQELKKKAKGERRAEERAPC